MDAAFIWNLSKLGRIGSKRLQFDDDLADRLNYQYTSVLLFLFIGLIGVRQYVGKPIQCWIPQEFTRGWEEYAENYCWVANTYFAPVENRLPPVPDRRELLLVYYQWAPIVMAAQALLFYLPCLIWRLGMAHSGFNLHRILQMASDANEMLPEAMLKTVQILAHYMRNCIQRQRLYKLPTDCNNHSSQKNSESTSVDGATYFYDSQIKYPTKSLHHSSPQISLVEEVKALQGDQICHHLVKDHEDKVSCDNYINNETNQTTTSNFSTENLNKSRGRKPAPPPPNHKEINEKLNLQKQIHSSQTESHSNKSDSNFNENVVLINQTSNRNSNFCNKETVKSKKSFLQSSSVKKLFHSSCGKESGNFLVTLYMFVKFAYITNVIGQIYLMQSFIGTKYAMYGAQVMIDLIKGQEWHHSGHFPRVTFCDLEAKKLGKNHIYTLQCVLPLNMFLEKIYIFLWFWHVTIAFITTISIIIWFSRIYLSHARLKFIGDHLKILNLINLKDDLYSNKKIHEFVNYYLGMDGIFLIRLITTNCGVLLAGELIAELWIHFQNSNLYTNKHLTKCTTVNVKDDNKSKFLISNYELYTTNLKKSSKYTNNNMNEKFISINKDRNVSNNLNNYPHKQSKQIRTHSNLSKINNATQSISFSSSILNNVTNKSVTDELRHTHFGQISNNSTDDIV